MSNAYIAYGNSTLVEQLTTEPKFEGSNPPTSGTEEHLKKSLSFFI
jgi:hypothetical protein